MNRTLPHKHFNSLFGTSYSVFIQPSTSILESRVKSSRESGPSIISIWNYQRPKFNHWSCETDYHFHIQTHKNYSTPLLSTLSWNLHFTFNVTYVTPYFLGTTEVHLKDFGAVRATEYGD